MQNAVYKLGVCFGAMNYIYIIYETNLFVQVEMRLKKSVARDLKAALCLLRMFC